MIATDRIDVQALHAQPSRASDILVIYDLADVGAPAHELAGGGRSGVCRSPASGSWTRKKRSTLIGRMSSWRSRANCCKVVFLTPAALRSVLRQMAVFSSHDSRQR